MSASVRRAQRQRAALAVVLACLQEADERRQRERGEAHEHACGVGLGVEREADERVAEPSAAAYTIAIERGG